MNRKIIYTSAILLVLCIAAYQFMFNHHSTSSQGKKIKMTQQNKKQSHQPIASHTTNDKKDPTSDSSTTQWITKEKELGQTVDNKMSEMALYLSSSEGTIEWKQKAQSKIDDAKAAIDALMAHQPINDKTKNIYSSLGPTVKEYQSLIDKISNLLNKNDFEAITQLFKHTTVLSNQKNVDKTSETTVNKDIQPVKTLDIKNIIKDLKSEGLPIGEVKFYESSDDPNNLLGKPGQYISKATFEDITLKKEATTEIQLSQGGTLEIFSNAEDAKNRYDHLSQLKTEYDILKGPILLRLSNALTDNQKRFYEITLTKVMNK